MMLAKLAQAICGLSRFDENYTAAARLIMLVEVEYPDNTELMKLCAFAEQIPQVAAGRKRVNQEFTGIRRWESIENI